MSESMIVGVDHGYAAMKTAHFSFPSGLVVYEHEPYTLKDVLEYGGKFYVVGSGRQACRRTKRRQRTTTSSRWRPSQRNSPSVMRSLRQRSIWRPDCPSPASGGRKTHSGSICSGMGKR